MRPPDIFLSEAMARAICWTLIHSLWQGILIAALAGIIIYCTRKLPAALRYNLLAADLLLFLLLAGITFSYELHRQDPGQGATLPLSPATQMNAPVHLAALIEPAGHSSLLKSINNLLDTHALLITGIWLVCLSIQLLRVGGGLYQTGRIRRNGTLPSGSYWIERLGVLAGQLGIRRPVALLETRGVQTPSAMGWWKPSILVPLGLLANLPPDQVETILLHELAHIRRNDYVANLVLHLTEAIFFFNPGLRWVAALLRREREACCDDMVLAGTPDRNSYLEALVTFTQWIIDEKPAVARPYTLQFGGGKTDLLWRVRRMINKENEKLQPSEKLILSFGLMALLSIGLVGMHPATVHSAAVHFVPQVKPRPVAAFRTDTIPSPPAASDQKPVTIEHLSVHSENNDGHLRSHAKATDKNGNHYEVRRKDGEVTEFLFNDQLIPRSEYDRYSAILDSIESARLNIKIPAAPATPSTPATPRLSTAQIPPTLSTPSTPPTPAIPQSTEHAPTPEDPLVYSNFQNPYAKQMLLDLIRDGLVGDLNHISFTLTHDVMLVNGIRQPDNIYQVYRAKYIDHPGDHMIYSQYYTPHGSGAHCECVHEPDMPAPN